MDSPISWSFSELNRRHHVHTRPKCRTMHVYIVVSTHTHSHSESPWNQLILLFLNVELSQSLTIACVCVWFAWVVRHTNTRMQIDKRGRAQRWYGLSPHIRRPISKEDVPLVFLHPNKSSVRHSGWLDWRRNTMLSDNRAFNTTLADAKMFVSDMVLIT